MRFRPHPDAAFLKRKLENLTPRQQKMWPETSPGTRKLQKNQETLPGASHFATDRLSNIQKGGTFLDHMVAHLNYNQSKHTSPTCKIEKEEN